MDDAAYEEARRRYHEWKRWAIAEGLLPAPKPDEPRSELDELI